MKINLEMIAKFDISQYIAFRIMLIIIVFYVALTFGELFVNECSGIGDCYDYDRRMARLAIWDINWLEEDFRHSIHFTLLAVSGQLFHNFKFLVLVSSTLLLVVTYLLTVNLTNKRLSGIIAVFIVLQSSVFYVYDTSVTYPSFWALLFITSIYLITTKQSYYSPIPYIFSVPAKALTALFIPSTIAFSWFLGKKKIAITYLIISIVALGLIVSNDNLFGADGGFLLFDRFVPLDFAGGFVSWMWKGFGSDQSTLLMLIVFGFLVYLNRKKIPKSSAVLSMFIGMVFTAPFLIGTTSYDVWPYRQLPLVVIVGVLGGMILAHIDKIDFSMFALSKAGKASTSSSLKDEEAKQHSKH